MRSARALGNGPLEGLFSGNATAKMLDFLIAFQEWDYSETDIAKNSGVSIRTVQREIEKLVRLGLLESTRTVGRAKMYRLAKGKKAGLLLEKAVMAIAAERVRSRIPQNVAEANPKLKKLLAESTRFR